MIHPENIYEMMRTLSNAATVVCESAVVARTGESCRGGVKTTCAGVGFLVSLSTDDPTLPAPICAQVTEEGNIECLYHGWQFEGSTGSCVKIPQVFGLETYWSLPQCC